MIKAGLADLGIRPSEEGLQARETSRSTICLFAEIFCTDSLHNWTERKKTFCDGRGHGKVMRQVFQTTMQCHAFHIQLSRIWAKTCKKRSFHILPSHIPCLSYCSRSRSIFKENTYETAFVASEAGEMRNLKCETDRAMKAKGNKTRLTRPGRILNLSWGIFPS